MSTADLQGARWRTSTFSGGGNEGNCVQVAHIDSGAALRDSKNPTGAMLVVGPAAWDAFVGAVRL